MTRTEERLADALDAAARAVPEDTMRPLQVPEREAGRRVWIAPVAAAASLLLVVGLATAVAVRARGPARSGSSPAAVPAADRYYVVGSPDGDPPVVRSAVTGQITATVPVPRSPHAPGSSLAAAAPGGVFFVAAWVPRATGEKIYRFRVTAAGRVSGFAAVPGGVLGGPGWSADAMAAAPGGGQVAIAFSFIGPAGPAGNCGSAGQPSCPAPWPSDYIIVLNTVTGKQSVWQGGLSELGKWFSVGNLSWAGDGHELVFFGQGCPKGQGLGPGSESCGTGRAAEARTLDPAAGGGRLDSGRLLLRQSARYPYIAQAVISPGGSTITAIVLTGPVTGHPGIKGSFPDHLAVEQISVRTGKLLGVLYRRELGEPSLVLGVPDPLALIPDGAGQHWLLNVSICSGSCTAGSSGWIDRGTLVPLAPAGRMPGLEAW
jgi:hypothetical protein